MTQWNPVWKVEIDGVEYTDAILANLSIRSGRTNIYEQAQAGYVNIQLLDVSQSIIPVSINSTISVSIKDTSNTFVAIFGGNVVDIGLEIRDVGSTMFTQTYSITALGALARLSKALTNGVLSKAFDGNQIYTILSALLLNT
jgi:predicted amino acid-binding ACT domain protein